MIIYFWMNILDVVVVPIQWKNEYSKHTNHCYPKGATTVLYKTSRGSWTRDTRTFWTQSQPWTKSISTNSFTTELIWARTLRTKVNQELIDDFVRINFMNRTARQNIFLGHDISYHSNSCLCIPETPHFYTIDLSTWQSINLFLETFPLVARLFDSF